MSRHGNGDSWRWKMGGTGRTTIQVIEPATIEPREGTVPPRESVPFGFGVRDVPEQKAAPPGLAYRCLGCPSPGGDGGPPCEKCDCASVEAVESRLSKAWDEVAAATRALNEARRQRRARQLAERRARD